jgi:hypothetical protein
MVCVSTGLDLDEYDEYRGVWLRAFCSVLSQSVPSTGAEPL